jgi:hypothetical protein
MLTTLKAAEDELIELTDEDIADLLGDLRGKVDAIRELMRHWEAKEAFLAAEIKELTARKKSVTASRERFKTYMLRTMNGHEFKQLPGERFDLKVISRKAYKATMAPTAAEYLELQDFVGVVKKTTNYAFDHSLLTKAFKADPERLAPYMEEGTSQYIKFNLRGP